MTEGAGMTKRSGNDTPSVIPENFAAERRNLSGSRSTAIPLGSMLCALLDLCLSFDFLPLSFSIVPCYSRLRGNDKAEKVVIPDHSFVIPVKTGILPKFPANIS